MSVSGGDYRGFVLRPVIKAVEKKHRRIEFHRFTLGVRQPVSAQNIRNIPERPARKILLIHCPHLAVAVLLKGEQPAKGRGKFVLGPISELCFAEFDKLTERCGGVILAALGHGFLRQLKKAGTLGVPLLHSGGDAVEDVTLVFIVLIERAFRHAEPPRNVADRHRLVAAAGKKFKRRQKYVFLCAVHNLPSK